MTTDLSCAALRARLSDLPAAIAAAENRYHRQVDAVAARLLSGSGRQVVLLAGPSSSGKTTTANFLADRLRAAGHFAAVVSLDDFYRSPAADPAYPRLPDGTPDFESVDALHTDEIHACMETLLSGEEYPVPRYDFKIAARRAGGTPLRLPPAGVVIFEGLHALNPKMDVGMSDGGLLRLFVSVSTNIAEEDGTRVLSGRKIRFLRRLCRDHLYRAFPARRTYEVWQNVLAGENRNLYPYKHRADCAINTFHDYEIGVLRPFDEALLSAPDAPQGDYIEVVRAALSRFAPIPADLVPETSLLREFIPGGVYESLYLNE